MALESGNRALAIYYYRALIKVKPQSRDATTARQRLEGIRTALEQELAADKARRQPAPPPPPPP